MSGQDAAHLPAPPGYEVLSVLGRGGFATVYRARQTSLGREVAVKVLMSEVVTDADRRRFDRERRLLAALDTHPHVVDVHDAGITGGRPYVVMRLYPGGTLHDLLRRQGPLHPGHVVQVVEALAAALDAAHALGATHRDVKPENVLLTEHGAPVLADFGIAGMRAAEIDAAPTHLSTAFCTPAHAAPEVLEAKAFSVASDVYSLASTAYTLLAGAPAFDTSTPRGVVRVLDEPPPPLPHVPAVLEVVVLAGLAKSPAARPATAGQFAAELRRAWQSQVAPPRAPALPAPAPVPAPAPAPAPVPVHAAPGSAAPGHEVAGVHAVAGPAPAVPARRRPGLRATASAVAALVAVGAALVVAFVMATPGDPVPTTHVATLVGGGDVTSVWGWNEDGSVLAVQDGTGVRFWDPDGDLVGTADGEAWQGPPGGEVWAQVVGGDELTVRTTAGNGTRSTWTDPSGAVQAVEFSPDGTWAAVLGQDDVVRLVDTARGTSSRQVTSSGVLGASLTWSPDGTYLAFVAEDVGAALWPVDDTDGEMLLRAGDVLAAVWSPDGSSLALTLQDQVEFWEPLTRTRTAVARGTGQVDLVDPAVADGTLWSPTGDLVVTTTSTGTVLWDPLTGTAVATLEAPEGELGWSPDGTVLVTGRTDDAGFTLWRTATGERLHDVTTWTDEVEAVRWSPDGDVLAVVHDDGASLWDPVSAERVARLTTDSWLGPDEGVWSPDGTLLALADGDGTVQVWRVH